MKHIAILLVAIGMACSANAVEPLKLDDLVGNVFESVSAEGTNIVLKFKASGRRFKYGINDTAPQINVYGEELRVPIGAHIRIVDRETEMVFSPLPLIIRDVGFHVRSTEDHRSGGKMRQEKEGYLVFQERLKSARSISGGGAILITEASVDAVTTLLTNKVRDACNDNGPNWE